MNRTMQFNLTHHKLLAGVKTMTRRVHGTFSVGDQFNATLRDRVLGVVTITAIRDERLRDITQEDIQREGFRGMNKQYFIDTFCGMHKSSNVTPESIVSVITFTFQPGASIQLGLFGD